MTDPTPHDGHAGRSHESGTTARSRRWERVKSIFQEAMELEPADRALFLDGRCASEPDVRREVEQLLGADEAGGTFLEAPAWVAEPVTVTSDGPRAGQLIGRYRLVREVGRGGMGTVWLAERADGVYEQRVAVKLIHGGVHTAEILSRFDQERQVLASLTHPGIARLLDGGTTERGLPYLVMEFVEGDPLDRYCDERRLTVRRRLELFLDVCAAIQEAHRNLVVHRDLKPGNILVADGPEGPRVKLLDFGIAKLLDLEASAGSIDVTVTELRLMTPRYASPEQVRGELSTTATDVYALGVILYELLTGRRPYAPTGTSRHDFERAICETDPPRPSAALTRGTAPASDDTATIDAIARARTSDGARLTRQLRGDLDTIVLTALRKEPERRYDSVARLAQDVRCYLDGMPVSARPDTVGYRARKFIQRHAVGVVVAALFLLTLLAALAVSVGLFVRAERAREVATIERGNAIVNAQRADEARRHAEHRAYLASIHAAESAIRDDDVVAARRHLEEAPAELRGWEWNHLHGRLDRASAVWPPAPDGPPNAECMTLSHDGTLVATGAIDGSVTLRDRATGAALRRFGRHRLFVRAVAFAPDDRRLATGSGSWISGRRSDGTIRLWDVASGERVGPELAGHTDAVQTLLFLPDGRLVSGSSDSTIRVWDVEEGVMLHVLEEHEGEVRSLALTPDGRELLSVAWDGTLRVWDVDRMTLRETIEAADEGVQSVAVDPSGAYVATALFGGGVRLWKRDGWTSVGLSHGTEDRVAFSRDGTVLYTGSSKAVIRGWSVPTMRPLRTLRGHAAAISGLVIDGDDVLSTAVAPDGAVRVWTPDETDVVTVRAHRTWVYGVDVSPDGRLGASISGAARGRGAGSPAAEGVIAIWETATGAIVRRIPSPHGTLLGWSVRFSPDGGRLVSASADRTAAVWDVETGDELLRIRGHGDQLRFAEFSPDGRTIATASRDFTVRRWDAQTGDPVGDPLRIEGLRPFGCRFIDDGRRLVVGYYDGSVAAFDLASGAVDAGPRRDHTDIILGLGVSPDGRELLTASNDGTVGVLDALSLSPRLVLRGHLDGVHAAVFTPDGMRIATASNDQSIKLWEPAEGREMATLRGHEDRVLGLAFTPDGRRLVSGSSDWTVRIWDAGD